MIAKLERIHSTAEQNKQQTQKISEHDQEIPQSHTEDQPTAPRERATETLTVTRHQEDN